MRSTHWLAQWVLLYSFDIVRTLRLSEGPFQTGESQWVWEGSLGRPPPDPPWCAPSCGGPLSIYSHQFSTTPLLILCTFSMVPSLSWPLQCMTLLSAGGAPRTPGGAPPSVALPKYRGAFDAVATIARTEVSAGEYKGE